MFWLGKLGLVNSIDSPGKRKWPSEVAMFNGNQNVVLSHLISKDLLTHQSPQHAQIQQQQQQQRQQQQQQRQQQQPQQDYRSNLASSF